MAIDLLVTGFGGFGEFATNPTEEAVKALAAGPRVAAHVFRTAVAAVEEDLPRLLSQLTPRRVVLFGLAATSPTVRLERVARNRSSDSPDVDGAMLPSPIDRAGEEVLCSTLPLGEIEEALTARSVATSYSTDAGGYLCNYSFYRCQQLAPAWGVENSGFVHVPGEEAYRAAGGGSFDYLAVVEAVVAVLA